MIAEPLPAAADVEHVTDVLRRVGVLNDGRVSDLQVESSRATILSRIIRLRLIYDGAATDAPSSIILKTGHPDRLDKTSNAGRQEVAFYSNVGRATAGLVPFCFEAAWDEATNAWHLLLEDLTQSHIIASRWPVPPNTPQCERIVKALARFHAAWWDDTRLGCSVGAWTSKSDRAASFERFAQRYAGFADRLGDRLPPPRRELYQRYLDAAPHLWERYHTHCNLTITHGDAHAWNCFLPLDSGSDDVRLFDWDSWHIGMASTDLAYLMAMHWYPDRRQRLERALLDQYHAALLSHGVTGYNRRDLDDDYRLSVLFLIMGPVHQEAVGIPPVIWWNNLERILLAVDDLGCRDLLRG
jgi:hypothetical protein